MKINLQPMLDEMKQARGNPTMNHPELVKVYESHGHDDAQAAMLKHWQDVDQGLTSEYKQL